MALDENVASTLSGGVSATFGYSDDGSGAGPYEQLVTFLQGPVFALLFGQYTSAQEQKEWDKFVEKIEGIAEEAGVRQQAAWGATGLGGPTMQIRPGARFTAGPKDRPGFWDPKREKEARAELQGIIDRGEKIPERFRQHVEPVPGTGFLGAVGRVAEEGLAESERFYSARPEAFKSFADPIRTGYAGLEAEGRAGAAGLVSDQEVRERQLIGMQEGLGEQERRDINQAYRAAWGDEQARLVQSGLMGTGVASSAALNITRERTGAIGRFEERIRGERLDLSERLSGETLQAKAGALEFGLGLGRERLGVEAELGAAGLAYGDTAWQNRQSDRERFGLMPAEAALMAEEDWRRLNVGPGGIQYAPPYGTGQGGQIGALAF
jgi:hypothetical protein